MNSQVIFLYLIVTGISQTSRMKGIYSTKWLRETRDTTMYVG